MMIMMLMLMKMVMMMLVMMMMMMIYLPVHHLPKGGQLFTRVKAFKVSLLLCSVCSVQTNNHREQEPICYIRN